MNIQEQMEAIHDSVRLYMRKKYPDLVWFLSLHSNELSTYGGNTCPRCAIESAQFWIDENDIGHSQHEPDEPTIQ